MIAQGLLVRAAFCTLGCLLTAVHAMAGDLLPVLPDRPFPAVILPAEIATADRLLSKRFTDFWTPTEAEVAAAEKRIAEFLAKAPGHTDLRPTQRDLCLKVHDRPADYVRQYIGAVREGRRVIYCVGNTVGMAGPDRWRRQLVFWFDAACTWQIDYDVQDDTCRRFYHDEGF